MENNDDINSMIDRAEKNLERLIGWIAIKDRRSNVLLIVFIALISSFFYFIEISKIKITNWTILFLIISIAFSISGLFCIWISNRPRVKSPNDSLIFFDTISKMDIGVYMERAIKCQKSEYLKDLTYQCYVNSIILSVKMKYIKYSFDLMLSSSCAILLFMVFS